MSSPTLRVAHLGNLRPGQANGVHATIAGLARHLPSAGVDAEVWHLSRKVREPAIRFVDGVRVIDLPRYRPDKAALLDLPGITKDALAERSASVSVIHLHSVYQAENIAVARLGLDAPIVITPNGGYSTAVTNGRHRIEKAVWRRLWENALLRRAAVLHAVSPAEAHHLREWRPGSIVRLIPNAIDGKSLSGQASVNAEGPILFLGRIAIDHKGLDLLVDGYARACRGHLPIPHLVIAGVDFRGGIRSLSDRIRKHGIEQRVTLRGPAYGAEKNDLVASARCFVHTSRWEGFPFAVLEAMALGIPVMVTEGTNTAELVRTHGSGIVVTTSVEGIARGLEAIGKVSASDLDELGNAGLRTLREAYTWERVAPAMADLYRDVIR